MQNQSFIRNNPQEIFKPAPDADAPDRLPHK